MRTTRSIWSGVVCGLLACGAFSAQVLAAEPPVLNQTAFPCPEEDANCWNIDSKAHAHPALSESGLKDGKPFRVNRKWTRPYMRFIDVQDDASDEIQIPALHMVNPNANPLSIDSLELAPNCEEVNQWLCLRLKPFPFAFGIHDLKNAVGPPTPHAILYVPARFDNGDPKKGDTFFLFVLHIPNTDTECAALKTPIGRKHCLLLRTLSDAWSKGFFSRDVMKKLIASEYRHFFELFFPGPGAAVSGFDAKEFAPLMGMSPFKLDKQLVISVVKRIYLSIRLHNDIIHGKLQ